MAVVIVAEGRLCVAMRLWFSRQEEAALFTQDARHDQGSMILT